MHVSETRYEPEARHVVRGTITDGELMSDYGQRWNRAKRGYTPIEVKFRPERATVRWNWDWKASEWKLVLAVVQGPRIKVDGTEANQDRSMGFARGFELAEDAPAVLVDMVRNCAPNWKPVHP